MHIIERLQVMLTVLSERKDEKGAAMVEYALLVALIAVVVVVALGPLGTAIRNMFVQITGSL